MAHELDLAEGPAANHFDHIEVGRFDSEGGERGAHVSIASHEGVDVFDLAYRGVITVVDYALDGIDETIDVDDRARVLDLDLDLPEPSPTVVVYGVVVGHDGQVFRFAAFCSALVDPG